MACLIIVTEKRARKKSGIPPLPINYHLDSVAGVFLLSFSLSLPSAGVSSVLNSALGARVPEVTPTPALISLSEFFPSEIKPL